MNIGLVLSGGMVKGAYQIGALKAIQNFIPIDEIKYISGASIGVLNGYAFATNKLKQAEEMWKETCYDESRVLVNQILKSSVMQRNIQKLSADTDTLPSKFYVSLFDYSHKSIVYKNISSEKGSTIQQYLKASIALPVYNKAIRINEIPYFDGAMIDNIPVYPLMKHKLDYLICIYFDDMCYKFENNYFDNKIIKVTFPSKTMLRQSLVANKDNIDEMICVGYEYTKDVLSSLLQEGYKNTNYLYE